VTIKFHDVSHHNGDYHPTGPTIAKASQGDSFVDPQYATNKARTLAGDWPFVGYHWVESAALSSTASQATHALAVIGRSTPMMADIEVLTDGAGRKTWPTFDDALDWCKRVLDGGGMLTLAYIPEWFWSGEWGGRSLRPFADLGLALISSRYTTYADDGPGWDPYGGWAPEIWQFTSTPIDTNAFRGTVAELGRLFDGGTPAGDTGVDMALTDADAAVIWNHLLHNDVTGTDVAAGTFIRSINTGVNDLRTNLVPALAVSETSEAAAIAALSAKFDGVPAAVVAALPPIVGGQPGFTDAQLAQVEAACVTALGHLGLVVAP